MSGLSCLWQADSDNVDRPEVACHIALHLQDSPFPYASIVTIAFCLCVLRMIILPFSTLCKKRLHLSEMIKETMLADPAEG